MMVKEQEKAMKVCERTTPTSQQRILKQTVGILKEKILGPNTQWLIITLNANILNFPIKRYRLEEWNKKQ